MPCGKPVTSIVLSSGVASRTKLKPKKGLNISCMSVAISVTDASMRTYTSYASKRTTDLSDTDASERTYRC